MAVFTEQEKQIMRKNGVAWTTAYGRIKNDWPRDLAISMPVTRGKNRKWLEQQGRI